jgi:hypothetical protein
MGLKSICFANTSEQNKLQQAWGRQRKTIMFFASGGWGYPRDPHTELRLRLHVEDRRRRATVTDGASLRSRLYSSAAAPGRTGAAPRHPGLGAKAQPGAKGIMMTWGKARHGGSMKRCLVD